MQRVEAGVRVGVFLRSGLRRFLPALLVLAPLVAAPVQAGTAIVTTRGDLITARFTDVTAAEAFAALREATGVEVVLPAGVGEARLTADVEGLSVQAAVRPLLEVLGLTDFVLIFEADGRAERLVVHATARVPRGAEPAQTLPAAAAAPPELVPPMSPEEEQAFVKEQERISLEIFGLPPIDAGAQPGSPGVRR